MEWQLVSRSALGVVVDEYFVAHIVSVEDIVGNLKNLLDEGPRNWYISVGIP
jgi:Mg2+/Co2+ transporter CorB